MSSFYFYDLETSGVSPRRDRVMQFGGQRTDRDLKPIGQPDNFLIKLTADILPDPYAVLITGITPQQTLASGITEAQFLRHFTDKIATPDTIILGFNNVRFDDEFMRFMLWRNFYDAYEWQWKDGCSRWDLLDLVRMTRALRPEGIKWPYAPDGKPTNRLEFLSAVNKLTHINPHDALSDVTAAIDVARLIKSKQPKLFDYLLNVRAKQKAAALAGRGEPFIYTSGKYPSKYAHTTLAVKLADHPDRGAAIVYDLRVDPKPFIKMTPDELVKAWQYRPWPTHKRGVQGVGEQRTEPYMQYGKGAVEPATQQTSLSASGVASSASQQASAGSGPEYFPVKILSYNRCPAIAPANVLDAKSAKRLGLSPAKIAKHLKALPEDFGDKLVRAAELMSRDRQAEMVVDPAKVDEQLYDGFVNGADKLKMSAVRAASAEAIDGLHIDFNDDRLNALLPLYKARNFPASLEPDEKAAWGKFKKQRLTGGKVDLLAQYFNKLDELSSRPALADAEKFVLEELRQYGESAKPASWHPAAPAATKRGDAK